MPYIYKITNKLNGKLYIGQTSRTVEERWKEHQRDCARREFEIRPLYRAINKYGIDNFSIETIEETDNPNEREKFWIEYYDSFKNGYNATLGGDGKPYLDYDLICKMYEELKDCSKISKILNIDAGHISDILKSRNIKVIQYAFKGAHPPKIIHMYSLLDEYLYTFPSVQSAAEWCVENNFCKQINSGVRSHIAACANGKRKTAYQHKWKYA